MLSYLLTVSPPVFDVGVDVGVGASTATIAIASAVGVCLGIALALACMWAVVRWGKAGLQESDRRSFGSFREGMAASGQGEVFYVGGRSFVKTGGKIARSLGGS